MKQADLDSLMDKAEARGDRELLKQLKEQDLAAKFQDLVTKIQMTFKCMSKVSGLTCKNYCYLFILHERL